MHGQPDDVRAPGFCGGKVLLVPMFALAELVRVARAKAAENHRLPIGVNEVIALYGDPGELRKRGGGQNREQDAGEQRGFHGDAILVWVLYRDRCPWFFWFNISGSSRPS